MKKISVLLGALLVSFAVLFTGCSGDEDALEPTITIASGPGLTTGDVTVEPGELVMISIIADAGDANLVSIDVTKDQVSLSGYPMEDIDKTQQKDTIMIIAPLAEATYSYVITVTDKDGLTASQTFKITVAEAGPVGTSVKKVTPSGAMGAQAAAEGSYINLSTGTVYGQSAAAASPELVDMICYYNSGAFLVSATDPGIAANTNLVSGLTTKNATKIAATTLTAADFDAITDTYDFSSLTISGTSASVTAGTVFAFETVSGKKGLVKVISVPSDNTGSATISIIIEV